MLWYHALFSFKGRLNRQGFWTGFGINFAFLFVVANFWLNTTAYSWLTVLPLLLCAYSLSAVIVKRLHDRDRSAKALAMVLVPIACYACSLVTEGMMAWLLGMLMPMFIGTLLLLEWGVFAGMPTENRYGERGLSIQFREKNV